MGKQWKQCQTLFFWAPKSLQMVIAAMKLRRLLLGRKVMTNLDSILKGRDITLTTKVHLVKAMVFPMAMSGEGNGNPLWYSCLENPVDRGAWWAAIYEVAQSRTQLKQFS